MNHKSSLFIFPHFVPISYCNSGVSGWIFQLENYKLFYSGNDKGRRNEAALIVRQDINKQSGAIIESLTKKYLSDHHSEADEKEMERC